MRSGLGDNVPGGRVKSKINTGGVGNERKGDVRGTQEGGSAAEAAGNPLRGAMAELRSQHPHGYDDHGPHHGTNSHVRHMPHPYGGRK